jgi:RimJ/RimL family protein N-acetyltransferase
MLVARSTPTFAQASIESRHQSRASNHGPDVRHRRPDLRVRRRPGVLRRPAGRLREGLHRRGAHRARLLQSHSGTYRSLTLIRPPDHLNTARLCLRAWAPDDATQLAHTLADSDAHLRLWTPWVIDGRLPGQSLEERIAQQVADFRDGTAWVYALRTRDGPALLGGCGLHARVGEGALELGYWLARGATGHGYAREGAGALTALALSWPSIKRVEIRCDPRNAASMTVPRHLGYRTTGTVPNALDTLHPLIVWSLTRTDALGPTPDAVLSAGGNHR